MTSRSNEPLTSQEHTIMEFVARGASNEQIAYDLNITAQTVTSYIRNVRQKLSARNKTAAAVQYYLRYRRPAPNESAPTTSKPLTAQEHRVIELVSQGFSERDIAEQLAISLSTVKQHLGGICQKFAVPNRTAAAVEYYRHMGASSYKKKTGSEKED